MSTLRERVNDRLKDTEWCRMSDWALAGSIADEVLDALVSEETIEAVARAAYARGNYMPWEERDEEDQQAFLAVTALALTAAREVLAGGGES